MRSTIDDPTPRRLVTALLAAVLTLAPPVVAGASAPSHLERPESRNERVFTGEDDAANDTRIPIPEVGVDSVAGGDRVTVRWSGLPPDVEELEILLSVDDGRHFERRVSPELGGDVTEYTWTVPDLGAAHARLRMRARRDGREVEGPIGPAFTLRSRGRPRDAWIFRDAGFPAPDEAAAHAGGWLASPGSRLGRAVDAAGSAEAPVRVAFGRRRPRVALGADDGPTAPSPVAAATGTSPLRHHPLRN